MEHAKRVVCKTPLFGRGKLFSQYYHSIVVAGVDDKWGAITRNETRDGSEERSILALGGRWKEPFLGAQTEKKGVIY